MKFFPSRTSVKGHEEIWAGIRTPSFWRSTFLKIFRKAARRLVFSPSPPIRRGLTFTRFFQRRKKRNAKTCGSIPQRELFPIFTGFPDSKPHRSALTLLQRTVSTMAQEPRNVKITSIHPDSSICNSN
jgi:hypothetical protein